jgi:thiol-disulfide isomerase/thioredoxin
MTCSRHIVAGFIALLASPALAADAAWIGKHAPDFTLRTIDNRASLTLSEFRGRIVIVDFWASWCGPCKRSLPQLSLLSSQYKDVTVLAVNIDDDRRNGVDFLRRSRIQLIALYDEKKSVVAAYDVSAMPSAFVVDRKGVVRFVHVGYSDVDIQELKRQIEELQ